MKNGLIVDEYGRQKWYKNDNLHRLDGPAINYDFWFIHDVQIKVRSDKDFDRYMRTGVVTDKHYTIKYYKNTLLNRASGEAYEKFDDYDIFKANHIKHRLDGPAVEYRNGDKEWWYEGKQINVSSQEEFEKHLAEI